MSDSSVHETSDRQLGTVGSYDAAPGSGKSKSEGDIEMARRLVAEGDQAGLDDVQMGIRLGELVRTCFSHQAYADAVPPLLRLLDINLAEGEDRPEVATVLATLATARHALGEEAEAAQLWEEALAIRERWLPANHFLIARTVEHLADVRVAQGRMDDALSLLRRALTIWQQTVPPTDPVIRTTAARIADLELLASEESPEREAGGGRPASPHDSAAQSPASGAAASPQGDATAPRGDTLGDASAARAHRDAPIAFPYYVEPNVAAREAGEAEAERRRNAQRWLELGRSLLTATPETSETRASSPATQAPQARDTAPPAEPPRSYEPPPSYEPPAPYEAPPSYEPLHAYEPPRAPEPAAFVPASTEPARFSEEPPRAAAARSRRLGLVALSLAVAVVALTMAAFRVLRSDSSPWRAMAKLSTPVAAVASDPPVPEGRGAKRGAVVRKVSGGLVGLDPKGRPGPAHLAARTHRKESRAAAAPAPPPVAIALPSATAGSPIAHAVQAVESTATVRAESTMRSTLYGRALTLEASRKGVASAPGAGAPDAGTAAASEAAETKAAVLIPASAQIVFPPSLLSDNATGRVLVDIVVDANGRADARLARVVHSDNPLFTDAVLHALPTMRFVPAEANGQRVAQRLEVPFRFVHGSARP